MSRRRINGMATCIGLNGTVFRVELDDGSVHVFSLSQLIEYRLRVAYLIPDESPQPRTGAPRPHVGKIPVDDWSRDAMIPHDWHQPRGDQ